MTDETADEVTGSPKPWGAGIGPIPSPTAADPKGIDVALLAAPLGRPTLILQLEILRIKKSMLMGKC